MNVKTIENQTVSLVTLSHSLNVKSLRNEEQVVKVAQSLATFAALQTQTQGIQVAVGGVAYKILQLPLDEQKPIVTAMAEAIGVPVPSYEGAMTGRIQLAHVVYGKQPDKCKVKRGDKDSLAGKSLSECIRRYKIEAGIAPKKKKAKRSETAPPRTMRVALLWLNWVAKTAEESALLVELMERLGFEAEKVEEWLEVEEAA